MNLENARNFYITAKEYFSDDEFANFHKYFGNTWMNLEDNEYVKFNLVYGVTKGNLNLLIQEIIILFQKDLWMNIFSSLIIAVRV